MSAVYETVKVTAYRVGRHNFLTKTEARWHAAALIGQFFAGHSDKCRPYAKGACQWHQDRAFQRHEWQVFIQRQLAKAERDAR